MGRSALRAALAAEKGVDFKKLQEKKRYKAGLKEKAKKGTKKPVEEGTLFDDEAEESDGGDEDEDEEEDDDDDEEDEDLADFIAAIDESDESDSEVEMEAKIVRPKTVRPVVVRPAKQASKKVTKNDKNEDDEDDEDDDEDEEDEDEEELAWSDLDEEARVGLAVQQRQTINNTTALAAALARIRVPTDAGVPFALHQCVVPLATPTADGLDDIQDDVARELQLYRQAREAAILGRRRLRREGVAFARPADYFAEMVKDDEHMQQVRAKLVAAAAAKKASAEARRQRDLKKFGKQVQVAKLQERAKAKKESLEQIKTLKRKRQETGATTTHEADDLFDVAVDHELAKPTKSNGKTGDRRSASDRRGPGGPGSRDRDHQPNGKRQKKNEKYGFGGRKRHAKSGDAISSGDLSGFNAQRMKGSSSGAYKTQRPGKARRKAAAGRR